MNVQYIIIIIVMLIVAIAITRTKKKDFKIESNKLVEYLGGLDNIIDYEFNMSKFSVRLNNVDIVDKEGIQKIGAQGVLQIDNQLKIVLGNNAKLLKKYIKDLRK